MYASYLYLAVDEIEACSTVLVAEILYILARFLVMVIECTQIKVLNHGRRYFATLRYTTLR